MIPRPGRLFAFLIVTTWLVLFGSHLWKAYSRRDSVDLVDLGGAPRAGATLSQRGVFYRGARIGYLREQRRPEGDGFQTEQQGIFTLNVMGHERTLRIEGGARVEKDGRLRTFRFRLTTESGTSPFDTQVRGEIDGGELVLRIRSGDTERVSRRRLEHPIVLPLNLYPAIAARGLVSNETIRLQLFDPLTLSEGAAEIRVLEPEVVRWGDGLEEEAFRLRVQFSGLTTTAWVTTNGEVLREETPLGWTLVKESPGIALSGARGSMPDVLSGSAIPAIGFSGETALLTRARLRLNEFPLDLAGLEGGRQTLSGNELVVTREVTRPTPSGLPGDEREAALASDAFVQSDAPEIRKHARRLTEGLPPLDAARALWKWVYESVRKTPTLSLPSALEVLEQRAGDCNEHTVLFTALARAADIPTRICTGLTYTGGQFYYHAWAEVWVGRWLAVDPTLGQFPADPLHVRLLVGGIEHQHQVLGLMGRGATIEVLEVQ